VAVDVALSRFVARVIMRLRTTRSMTCLIVATMIAMSSVSDQFST